VTIASSLSLAGDLASAPDAVATINALAEATMDTSEAAVSHLMASVEDLRAGLSTTTWEIIESALGLTDQRAAAAAGLREKLTEALAADQHAIALRPVLRDVQSSATRLLRETTRGASVPTQQPPPPPAPPPPLLADEEVLDERPQTVFDASEAATALDELRARVSAEPRPS